MEQDKSPQSEDKDAEVELGDLTPEKDAKGGVQRVSPGTGGKTGGPVINPD